MNQAFHLFRLQQIDTQLDQVTASLAEINRLLSNDETVRIASLAVDDSGKLLHQEKQKLKQLEFAVKEQQIKINQCESNLYGGKIRNPKELQDLQKDIASLKKHLAIMEDQQLEAMVSVEQRESEDANAHDQLRLAQAAFAEKSASWLGQKDQLIRNIDRLNAERATIVPPIDPDNVRIYESIRRRKSGVAVTTARDGSCVVCGTNIRPMELQSARAAQELVYCTSCGRILYVG